MNEQMRRLSTAEIAPSEQTQNTKCLELNEDGTRNGSNR